MPASRRARATTFTPRSWPSRPTLATRMRTGWAPWPIGPPSVCLRSQGTLVSPLIQASAAGAAATLVGAMSSSPDLIWQPSLLDAGPDPDVDETFAAAVRIQLDRRSCIERDPGWVSASDVLFDHLLNTVDW